MSKKIEAIARATVKALADRTWALNCIIFQKLSPMAKFEDQFLPKSNDRI